VIQEKVALLLRNAQEVVARYSKRAEQEDQLCLYSNPDEWKDSDVRKMKDDSGGEMMEDSLKRCVAWNVNEGSVLSGQTS
jgi:hypothetical protein